MKFEYPSGATPLDPDEIEGLMPFHIATLAELNEWEALNILQSEGWAFSISHRVGFLERDFIQLLHKKMFNNTWRWAGKFRKTNKNIGSDYSLITMELENLLADVKFQILKNSFSIDEIAYRFHHRLVKIHPFPNGNGRHARMMTDIFLVQSGRLRFSWGSEQLGIASSIRENYIRALKHADKHDYSALSLFVRS